MVEVSILIKALNEEANISRAIESALAAARRLDGEVVLADSGSTDRTVEIASSYPIRVVQLENVGERCCGVGPQLALQHSYGRYIYLMDGDMELNADFVVNGIAALEADPELAGVGGYIREMRTANLQFKGRARRMAELRIAKPVESLSLSGGGLYLRAALDSIDYMSDRNLHALEEYDLGVRLRKKGWRLMELPDHACDHHSYEKSTLSLLWHRIRSGSMLGQGEMLRAACISGYLPEAITINAIKISLAVAAFWLTVISAMIAFGRPLMVLSAALAVLGMMTIFMRKRHGTWSSALHSVVVWNLAAVFMLVGFVKRRRPPAEPIASKILHDVNSKAAAKVIPLSRGASPGR